MTSICRRSDAESGIELGDSSVDTRWFVTALQDRG